MLVGLYRTTDTLFQQLSRTDCENSHNESIPRGEIVEPHLKCGRLKTLEDEMRNLLSLKHYILYMLTLKDMFAPHESRGMSPQFFVL